jgi:hypothetical protein
LKVVQARLGHASIQMTADTYGHLFPRRDDGAELAMAETALLGNWPTDAPGMRCRLSPTADVPSHSSGGSYVPNPDSSPEKTHLLACLLAAEALRQRSSGKLGCVGG